MFRWFQLARRLSQLEDEMVRLTRIVEGRDLDWQDMRARVKRLLDRTEKAAARQESGVPSSQADTNGEELPSDAGMSSMAQDGSSPSPPVRLSPSQARLQSQIMRYRRMTQ